jgi:hypothetical protein
MAGPNNTGAEAQLMRSEKAKTGYKGVSVNRGRCYSQCTTPPCRNNHLGIFSSPEDAAQAYLQHHQEVHPEELKRKYAPLLEVHEHLLIRSGKNKSGFKGVSANKDRFKAECYTSPCQGT